MTRRLSSFIVLAVLAGTAMFLAARLIDEARLLGQAAAVETGEAGREGLATALKNEVIPPEPVLDGSYLVSEALEKPLFSPTRRPPVQVVAAPIHQPTTDSGIRDLKLHGIVGLGDRRMALLGKDASTDLIRVRAGDRVGDWRVIEIGANAVVLQSGNETHRIRLDYQGGTQ